MEQGNPEQAFLWEILMDHLNKALLACEKNQNALLLNHLFHKYCDSWVMGLSINSSCFVNIFGNKHIQ